MSFGSVAKAALHSAVTSVGYVPDVLNGLYSAARLVTVIKVNISVLTLLEQFQKNKFNDALTPLKGFKNVLYMTSFTSSCKEFFNENGSVKFPETKGRKLDWAKFFVMVGDIAEHGSWWNDVNLYHFPLISNVAGRFGSISVFGYEMKKLFYIEVLYRKAKDFFIVPAAIVKLDRFVREEFRYLRGSGTPRKVVDAIVIYSDAASNVGKLFLIPFGKLVGGMGPRAQILCGVIDLITNSLGLIKTVGQIVQEINNSAKNIYDFKKL